MARDTEHDPEIEELDPDAAGGEDATAGSPESLRAELEELRSRWMRAQADYQNVRRRAAADYEAGLKRALQPLLEELLFVLDYLDLALASPTKSPEAKNLALGVEMTRTKLLQALESADVVPIPDAEAFDPRFHEATETRPAPGIAAGTILSTVRRGYTWRDSVLRHAQVVVSAGQAGGAPEGAARS
jgi:molecular chaperone GrpE